METFESRKRLLITVHGIRTFGAWQDRLEAKVNSEVDEKIECAPYRYYFFTILAFLIPPFRWLATWRFQSWLLHQINREQWDRIDIVAHSFGTHLVALALLRIDKNQRPRIHTVIFAGSVLKKSFPYWKLVGTCIARLINDCGMRDDVLILNQLFVLFTGMAGRIGFDGADYDACRNRFFDFGHSGYFAESETGKPDFMSCYWIPVLKCEKGNRTA